MGRNGVANKLSKIYYTPSLPPSLGGIRRVNKHLKKIKSSIISQNVAKWLRGEDSYTLHRTARKRFPRQKTIVYGENKQLQADLADMQQHSAENDNFKYLLTVIDVFSKKASAIPLKSKSGKEVAEAFDNFLSVSAVIKSVQTDKGREFYNSSVAGVFRKYGVKHFSTHDERTKASVVERWNKTLKQKLYRWFTKTGKYRYIDILSDVVDAYNETEHRSIGLAPNDVNNSNREEVWHKLYPPFPFPKQANPFLVGDYVRISRAIETFDRGFTPNWSYEIFRISEVMNTIPTRYRLEDLHDDSIQGSFYKQELQLVSKPETFKIEKIIKTHGRGRNKQYFVKFKGYSDKFNEWVDSVSDIN